MVGMAASAGPAASFPALAVVLALFMLGYIVWTTDRLTSLARAKTATVSLGRDRDSQVTRSGPDSGAPPRRGRRPRHASRRRDPGR